MAALAIVRRDLLRMLRNPGRTALVFALPLVFAGIFTLVFGGDGSAEVTVRVLLLDEDDSLLSRLAQGAGGRAGGEGRLEVVQVGPEGWEMMERGEASALLHVPAGFTEAWLDGEPTTLRVVKNPAQSFLPRLVEEGVGIGAVVLSEGRRVLDDEVDAFRTMLDSEGVPDDAAVAALSTSVNASMRSMERVLFPPVIQLETVTVQRDRDETAPDVNILSFFLPGLSLMGIFFLAQAATGDMLRDRESGMLRHLMTAPLRPTTLLAGKSLSVVVVCAAGFALLLTAGAVLGARWGPPLPVACLAVASAVGAAGTLLLLTSLVRTSRQADTAGTIVILGWSMLGGAFFPLSQMPDFMRTVAHGSLVFWGNDAFMTLILEDGGLADIGLNLAVLTGTGVVFLAAGAARLRRQMAAGRL